MQSSSPTDTALLEAVTPLMRQAGAELLRIFDSTARPVDAAALMASMGRNEEASMGNLRAALTRLRPQAGWVEGAHETAPLAPGEWWAVDAVEGNVNHSHGLREWSVNVALLRDGMPVLAAVLQPAEDRLYTALRGQGAWLNGARLQVSAKQSLQAAIASTGQAEPGQVETYKRLGDSVGAMLGAALLVRMNVPSTFPILLVATGQSEVFWQYAPVLSGLASGMLLALEAGAVVTRLSGAPWAPGATDVLISAPAVHDAAMRVLRDIG